MQSEYTIGCLSVYMTRGAAARWNSGDLTARDLRRSVVCIPETSRGLPTHREISLQRATCERLEPWAAEILSMGFEAVPVDEVVR